MSTLEHIGFAQYIIPEWKFRLSSVSKNPGEVTGWCDICGTIKPLICANGYIQQLCEHSRAARYAALNQHGEQPITTRCYTWLGKRASELAEHTFESFHPERQPRAADFRRYLNAAIAYAVRIVKKQQPDNLLLVGGYGVGKTHLAAAICNHLRGKGVSCLFCTAQELFEAFYAASFEEQQALIASASSTSLLVLDDLDKLHIPKDGEFQKKRLFGIINTRSVGHLPTIITTNEGRDLSQWFDGAAMSRLGEHMRVLVMDGVDYRAKGGK